MVTDNQSQTNGGNLYVASIIAFLFVFIAAGLVWAAQIWPSMAQSGAAEASPGAEQPAQASKGDPLVGQKLYAAACVSCHGSAGEGVVGLANDMTASEFIANQSDDALVEFIKAGRNPGDPHNVTGIGMPSKGGSPALNDQDLYNLVAHIRTLQNKLPAPAQVSKGDPEAGQKLFVTCAACHGPAGEGIQGLGKDMTTSEFIAGKTDDDLVAFIKVGRSTSDPLNTTGVDMPPKGGNPALSDDDLYNLVAYMRSIHK
jgi:disulfide bond formation protein DsbB